MHSVLIVSLKTKCRFDGDKKITKLTFLEQRLTKSFGDTLGDFMVVKYVLKK